jgi:hypothetical protein
MLILKNYAENKIKRKVKRKQGPVNKVKYIGKATTGESITGNDIGLELIERAKEVIDEEYRNARRKQRLIERDENFTWHKDMIAMWKQDIINLNDKLVVPRASFPLRKKLKVGLHAHLNKIAHIFEVACDRAGTDDEFQTTFAYCEFLMRKHVNDTIAKKDEKIRVRNSNGPRKEPKAGQLRRGLEEIKEARKRELCLIHQIAMEGSQIRAYAAMNHDPDEYRKNKQSAITALKYIADSSCDRTRLPYSCVSTNEFEQWAIETNFEQWHEEEIERNRFQVDENTKRHKKCLTKCFSLTIVTIRKEQ